MAEAIAQSHTPMAFLGQIEERDNRIYFFIWGFTSLSTLYRSYHDGYLEGQRKPVHIVCQGAVL